MASRTLLAVLLAGILHLTLSAQEGYRVEVEIDGFTEDQLYLGYYYGDKQYLKDTVDRSEAGTFVFEDDEPLFPGVYLVVLPPDNNYFQILIDEDEQRFRLTTRVDDLQGSMAVEGSPENTLFYDYLGFLEERRQEAQALADTGVDASAPEVGAIDQRVRGRQEEIIAKHPRSFTAAIIRANMPIQPPAFEGDEETVQTRTWRYFQKHFFDHIDLADPRMLRTPFLFERVDYYVEKLQVQHPDTLARAIDTVLVRMRPAPQTFKFYLIHFLNTYARSKIVGMDAVYVHLVENYYATGEADWTDEEQLASIIDNARRLKPLLIGQTAPDLTVQRRDGSSVSLHEVEAPYTVLYFWRYDCGHCKETTPHLKTFFESYQDTGVKIFALCVKRDAEEIEGCWEYVDEQEIGDWIHAVDPGYSSFFPVKYNIKSTPQIYVLDADKRIVSKQIGGEQLPELMDRLLEKQRSPGE